MGDKSKGYILVFLAGALWGLIGFFVTYLSRLGINSFTIAFLRDFYGTIFFIVVVILMHGLKGLKPSKNELLLAIAMGLICQTFFNISYTISINKMGVATGAILLYTSPMFITLLSRIVFKERLNRIKAIALIINISGCILTVTNGNFGVLEFSTYGVLMGTLAGLLYATLTIFGKIAGNMNCNVETISLFSFITATIALFFIAKPWNYMEILTEANVIVLSMGYGLIPTALAYYLYMMGLTKPVEASKVPVVASVETVIAALIGIVIFAEIFGIYKFIGILLVMISVVLISWQRKENVTE
ncbi:MAG TPA: DMT family transporter [Anaerovoracaceae bacterium]|nr:DMT family transporter [Anaerovoracaceae bacterium]